MTEVPYIDTYIKKIDNKYNLCIAVAKRARELGNYMSAKRNMERINVVPPLVDIESSDPLEIALNEIREGAVSYIRTDK
ncbi:MAG: DNA-directed RNA polymerase subunit omega [Actinomycetota bacterium]|nr:DNA-directed RNA polymerase subunit omega [Actinomycetota bacterium]